MNKNVKKTILTLTILALAAFSVLAATGTAISDETGLRNAFANGGTYYLAQNVTLNSPIEGSSGKTITIDLNGNDIIANQYYIEIGPEGSYSNSTATIKDTVGTGVISAAISQNYSTGNRALCRGSLFYVNTRGTLNLENVKISASKGTGATASSCRVIESWGTLNISGTTNIATSWKAIPALDLHGGTPTITGGTITGDIVSSNVSLRCDKNCNAVINGNITTSGTGQVSLYHCTINGNVTCGGTEDLGLRIHSGVTINGNLSSTGSAKVRTYDDSTGGAPVITGDLIATGNGGFKLRASSFFGEIYIENPSNFIIDLNSKEYGTDITFAADPSEYLADGQYSYYNSEGVYHLLNYKPVAVIGDTPYSSITAALAAAQEGDIIVLNQSLTENVTINKNVTIDIAGQTLKGNINSASGTTVNLVDTKGTGLSDGLLNNGSSGTIKITSGSFKTDPSAYVVGDDKFVKYDREKSVYTVTTPNNTVSLTLGGDIGINFFVDTESYTDDSNAYIKLVYDRIITIKGENLPASETIPLSGNGYDLDKLNRAIVKVAMGPVQLINSVSIYLYETNPGSADKLLYSKENYTPVEFCQSVVKNASSYDSELVELCKTLLNYGSMTQTYFKAQTSNLPNAGLNISGNVTSLDTSEWTDYYGEFDKNLPDYKGTSLICSTNMVVRHYFKDPIDDYTVTLSSKPDGSGMAITTGYNTTGYYVEVYGIESPYLDDDYTITLKDAKGNTYTITYSPMCYARKTVSRSTSDASLVNLCKSIYLYGSAAKEYFIAE